MFGKSPRWHRVRRLSARDPTHGANILQQNVSQRSTSTAQLLRRFFDPACLAVCANDLRRQKANRSRIACRQLRKRIARPFSKEQGRANAVSQVLTGPRRLLPESNERHSLSIPAQCSLFVASLAVGVGKKDLESFSELKNCTHLQPYAGTPSCHRSVGQRRRLRGRAAPSPLCGGGGPPSSGSRTQ